jgi:MFS family permease
MITRGSVSFFASRSVEVMDMATPSAFGIRSRIRTLYVSFGLSQASATAVDTLILLFAAKVLFAPERHIALLDAVGTIAYTVASVVFSLLWHHAPGKRVFTVTGFFSLGIPIFLFSSIWDLWMAYTLTTLFGALMVLPNALTASYLSEVYPRTEWASVYGKLGASGSLGSAVGLLLAIGWLAVASQFQVQGMGERTLFLAMGVLTVLSAVGAWHAVAGMSLKHGKIRIYKKTGSILSTVRRWLGHHAPPEDRSRNRALTEPVLNDEMRLFLTLTALLHVGFGMSFTGTMLYIIGDLKASPAIALLIVLVFRLAAYLVSNPAGDHLNQLMPLRFQQMAGSWRFLAVLALGLITLLPTGPWGVTAILPLIAAFGISSGILGVTGPVVTSTMVSTEKQPTAYLLFVAVSNGGAGAGAWLASLAAPSLGFPALLGISALVLAIALLLWHRL